VFCLIIYAKLLLRELHVGTAEHGLHHRLHDALVLVAPVKRFPLLAQLLSVYSRYIYQTAQLEPVQSAFLPEG